MNDSPHSLHQGLALRPDDAQKNFGAVTEVVVERLTLDAGYSCDVIAKPRSSNSLKAFSMIDSRRSSDLSFLRRCFSGMWLPCKTVGSQYASLHPSPSRTGRQAPGDTYTPNNPASRAENANLISSRGPSSVRELTAAISP